MALEFEIKLTDGVSAAAGSAAHQVDVLTKQMRGLQTAMIKANALGKEDAFKKAAATYDLLANKVEKLGGISMPKANTAIKKAVDDSQKLKKEVDSLGKNIGKTTKENDKGKSAFKNAATEMNAYLELAKKLGEVLRRVGEAISETVIGVYKFAAARAQLGATFTALGAGKVAGDDVIKMLDGLNDVLPYTRDEMAAWSKTMMVAGITDLPRLEQATKAAAAASSIFHDETGKTGEKVANLVVQFQDAIKMRQGISDLRMELRGTGTTSDQVAASLGITEKQLQTMAASGRNLSKIGDAIQESIIKNGIEPMRKMNASWDVISKKLKDNIAKIFDGLVNTEGFKQFANALQVMVQSFGQMTTSGKGMKSEMTGTFDAIFAAAAKLVEYMTLGLIYAQIEWINLKIQMRPITKAIKEIIDTFTGFFIYKDEITGATKTTQMFKDMLLGLKILFGAIAVAVGGLVFGIVFLSTAFVALIGLIARFVAESGQAFLDWASDAWETGVNFVNGIWDGIKYGWDHLLEGVSKLADDMVNAVKKKLGIASPSKVMMQVGGYTAEGMALGMERGMPRIEDAASGMSTVAVKGATSNGTASNKSGMTVNVGGITIQGGSGSDLMKLTEEAVVSLFERVALTQGVA